MHKDKINILHIRDSPWVDGPGRTILESASMIDKERFRYFIGAFEGLNGNNSPLILAAKERGLPVLSINDRKSIDLVAIKTILSYIDNQDIHIVHSHEIRSDLFSLFCAKRKNIKLVATLHGWIANDLKSKIKTYIDIIALHFFDLIIVVSERLKHSLMSYGISEKKIQVLRNSVISEHYIPNKLDDSFRKEFFITPSTILIGNIGRLSPEKGQTDLVHAAYKLIQKGFNVKFAMVGTGPDEFKLKYLCEELAIADSFIFCGFRHDMNSIYNSLDMVIQTSYSEGMPNVLIESLLMEKPVIATDVGGTPEIIENNVTGILIFPHDVETLSSAIINFIKYPEPFYKMAKIGKNRIIKRFNFRWRTQKLESLYIDLMQQ